MISFIKQFKTHDFPTYVKEIVLQHFLCLYEHESYSYSPKPRMFDLIPALPMSAHFLYKYLVEEVPLSIV